MDTDTAGQYEPGRYEIRLRGRLDQRWADWFDGMTVTTSRDPVGPLTILHGHVVDQAALHGAIARVRDVGLPLLSITRVDPAADEARADAGGDDR